MTITSIPVIEDDRKLWPLWHCHHMLFLLHWLLQSHFILWIITMVLTYKQLEIYGCIINTVDTDGLVAKAPGHQYPQFWSIRLYWANFIWKYCIYNKQHQKLKLSCEKVHPVVHGLIPHCFMFLQQEISPYWSPTIMKAVTNLTFIKVTKKVITAAATIRSRSRWFQMVPIILCRQSIRHLRHVVIMMRRRTETIDSIPCRRQPPWLMSISLVRGRHQRPTMLSQLTSSCFFSRLEWWLDTRLW